VDAESVKIILYAVLGYFLVLAPYQVFANDTIYEAFNNMHSRSDTAYGADPNAACAALPSYQAGGYDYDPLMRHYNHSYNDCMGSRVYDGYVFNANDYVFSPSGWTVTTCEDEFGTGNTTFNPETGECENPNPCEGQINPITEQCEECASGKWDLAGQCLADECYGTDMPVYNGTGDCVTVGGVACGPDTVTACIATGGTCSSVAGKVTFGDTDGDHHTFDYCNDDKNACEAEGGTYGAAGNGDEMNPICLVDYGDSIPTCVSGSQLYIENQHIGGTGFSCISATPPNDVCDGSKYDCDNDGQVDDQDKDGCVDNGGLNDFTSCSGINPETHAGTGTGETGHGPNDPNDPWSGTNIGQGTPGAGTCDATESDYAECIGLGEGTGGLTTTESQHLSETASRLGEIRDAVTGTGTAPGDKFTESDLETSTGNYYGSLQAVPIVAAVGNFTAAFAGAGNCPAPTFQAFGNTYNFDYHCTLYAQIAGVLSGAMFFFWSIVGIRHIMSA
jgi:hypothetical protein